MSQFQKISLLALRLTLGWMFLYAGITKVIDPAWSAAGFLQGAKTFPGFFQWLLNPNILPTVNFLNAWGLTLLGVSLILGIGLKLSSRLGVMLMLLYYLAQLDFPYPNAHSLLVDEHIIYSAALLVLMSFQASRVWGLEKWCSNLPICAKFPRLRHWLG